MICYGACMTYYIPKHAQYSEFETCTTCRAVEFDTIPLQLNCADGEVIEKRVNIVTKCACHQCGVPLR